MEVGIVLIVTCPQKSGPFLARKVTAVLSEGTAIHEESAECVELINRALHLVNTQ